MQALQKNIEEQLTRLLDQLKDLDELKEELDEGEYEELKAETLAQLADFEAYLERHRAENEQLAAEAALKIQESKQKLLGMEKMKALVEGQAVTTFRQNLHDLTFAFKQKKSIDENQYCQQAL